MLRRVFRAFVIAAMIGAIVSVVAEVALADPPTPPPPDEPPASPAPADFCDLAPSVGGAICDVVDNPIGWGLETILMGGAQAGLQQVVGFVVDGAVWLVGRVASIIDSSTRPDVTGGWFRAAYQDMALVAVLGLLPFLLLAILQGLVRQSAGTILRATLVHVPVAALGTAAAIVVVDMLVQLTDALSAWIARSFGGDLDGFATSLGSALATLPAPAGGAVAGMATLLAAGLIAFSAFVIWLELLLRQAAIYVAVLFMPLGFMALVWPATSHWLRRLVHGLVAIILSKFVIVAIMALAAGALGAQPEQDGFSVAVSGGALLSLAALAPYVLLRIIPVFEAGLNTQLEGTFRRPTAAVGPPAIGGGITRLIHQRVSGGANGVGSVAAARPGTTAAAAGTSVAAVAGAVATTAAAGATRAARAGARTAARTGNAANPTDAMPSDAASPGGARPPDPPPPTPAEPSPSATRPPSTRSETEEGDER